MENLLLTGSATLGVRGPAQGNRPRCGRTDRRCRQAGASFPVETEAKSRT